VFAPIRNVEIDARALERALDRVKAIEPKLKNNLTRDLRALSRELIPAIEEGVPDEPPLSGLTPRWGKPKSTVRTYPRAKPGRAIVTINVSGDSRPMAKYLQMTETAGTRSSGYTKAGKVFVARLNKRFPLRGRGGRFVWSRWLAVRGDLREGTVNLINAYIKKFNRVGRM